MLFCMVSGFGRHADGIKYEREPDKTERGVHEASVLDTVGPSVVWNGLDGYRSGSRWMTYQPEPIPSCPDDRKPAPRSSWKNNCPECKDSIRLVPMLSGSYTSTGDNKRLWLGHTRCGVPLGCLEVLWDHNGTAIVFHPKSAGEFLTSSAHHSRSERGNLEVNRTVEPPLSSRMTGNNALRY